MADRSRPNGEPKAAPGRATAGAMPRWVKLFAIVGVVLVVLFVVLHLTGHGFGHQMHMPAAEHGAAAP